MAKRLVVAGGRDFNDYKRVEEVLNQVRQHFEFAVVCGKAKGADTLGELYAKNNNLIIHYYPADWNKYGKSAGYRRNVEMAENAEYLVAFWDGKSRGTEHMINIAAERGLKVLVVRY